MASRATIDHAHLHSAPRWLHVVLGVGVVVGAWWSAGSASWMIGAIAYVTWMTGRASGLAICVLAGGLELHDQVGRFGTTPPAIAHAALWFALYVLIVLVIALVEIGTRPPPRTHFVSKSDIP